MGVRLAWTDDPWHQWEWAPPLRIISFVTLVASTLDLLADFLMCNRIAEFLANFQSELAIWAAYGYFFFTGVSVLVYVFEMIDVCLTLKYDEEDVFYARLAKSLVLAAEEVPLPFCMHVLFTNEPRLSLANPVLVSSWIKLIALVWGIVKFAKLRFCWFCLPCNPKHETRENLRRCFMFTPYRAAMLLVNCCHLLAIGFVLANVFASSQGGRLIINRQ